MGTDRVEVGRQKQIIFGELQRRPDGEVLSMVVAAELDGLTAGREVAAHYGNGFADLAVFFANLAENWRGWSGTRAYESLENDLLIDAVHTGSHVELSFTLHDPEVPGSWSLRVKLTLDAGEELTRASKDLKELFAPPQQPGR